jgi:hypothetical protein
MEHWNTVLVLLPCTTHHAPNNGLEKHFSKEWFMQLCREP